MTDRRVIRRVTEPSRDDFVVATLAIRLLGPPEVTLDGVAQPAPRGAKPWALLAYLAATGRPQPRSELATLLFGEAEDPLGALRWNLAAARRMLGVDGALTGDPVCLGLPTGTSVDLDRLAGPDAAEITKLPGEFLSGLAFSDSPAFETWLMTQRRRYRTLATSRLREAALARIGRGEFDEAVEIATQLVAADELDEGHHALLIRALAMAGDDRAAREHFDRCRQILETHVGVEPGPAVIAALHSTASDLDADASISRDEIEARLAVAWQSFLGGAIDHGIDLGRSVIRLADRRDDHDLRVAARIFLGAMLGMTVRGWDEAAARLNEALVLAGEAELTSDEAMIRGILAGNDMMRADYDAARRHLATGIAASVSADARAVTLTFLAAVEADQGDIEPALAHAGEAVSQAEKGSDPASRFYAYCHAARIELMNENLDRADRLVAAALELEAGVMPALRPWALAMRAEILAGEGDTTGALRVAQQALAASTATSIAWQQALALRSIGLAEAARGEWASAESTLEQALVLARRTTGEGYTFHWPVAFVLDSLSSVSQERDPAVAERWSEALLEHAAPIGMAGFAARARERLVARQVI